MGNTFACGVNLSFGVLIHIMLQFLFNPLDPTNEKLLLKNGKIHYEADSFVWKIVRDTALMIFEVMWALNIEGFPSLINVFWCVICMLGFLLGLACHEALGKHFTHNLGLFEDHKLIKTGIYRYLTHPSVTAEFICIFSACMFFNLSYTSTIIIVIYLFTSAQTRIQVEETFMHEKFSANDEYKKYCETRFRFIPNVKFNYNDIVF